LLKAIIHSWRAYDDLQNENYIHRTVNYSANFADSNTGIRTPNIERMWRELCANILHFGSREYHYKYYIAEFLFEM